ncbi:set 5 [Fusarium longipes]|uniref:Set 5 n=1 Tax=Fusarium longipes TaxID=694270 RepID=A0A395SY50_9HYPO|nr:set 5 [Fusarium longipes]
MNGKDGPPPEEPILIPDTAVVAIKAVSTFDPLLCEKSGDNRDCIIAGNNQETKLTDNQTKSQVMTQFALHESLVFQQNGLAEAQPSTSLDMVATEYGGTSESELDSTSDLEFSSEDEDCEHETTDDFVRKGKNYCDRLEKNGVDVCNSGTGNMDAPEYIYTEPASLPLAPTETTEAIFENEYFKVKRSHIAGWGAFAVRKLKEGDQILVEKPLFTATNLTLFHEFSNLSEPRRNVAYSLHTNSNIKAGTPVELVIWKTNAFATANPLNGYYDAEAGLFPIASRFNHACSPMNNVNWHYNYVDETLEMVVKAESIEAGQELTISYDTLSPMALYDRYGFQCGCGGCPGLSDRELAERDEYQW